jgi:hypothetical protein
MRTSFATLAVALLLAAAPATAAPPRTLSYQGFLTSSADAPIDAPVQMTFSIYTAPTGGAPLWSETQASVAVAKGEFSTILGNATALTLAFDVPYYLGIAVGSDPEMTPRQPLASSAYAFRALSLDSGATLPGAVLTGSIPTATVPGTQVTGSITTATLPGSQVTGSIDIATVPGSQVTGPITTATIPGAQVTGDLSGVNNIVLPDSTASVGNVIKNGTVFLHNFGTRNTFVGAPASNFTMTGTDDTAVGAGTLLALTSGGTNTAVGSGALAATTLGASNTAVGTSALAGNLSGDSNVAVGSGALQANKASRNAAVGTSALGANTFAADNTALGYHALAAQSFNNNGGGVYSSLNTAVGFTALSANQPTGNGQEGMNNTDVGAFALGANTSGPFNTAMGALALSHETTGQGNAGVGNNALELVTTGSFNTALGFNAGVFVTTGSNNIEIGNQGQSSDDGVIRIGTSGTQTMAFLAGVRNVTTSFNNAIPVLIDTNGQLGTLSSSRTVKQDIRDMGEASTVLAKLRPVTFHYKSHPDSPLQYGLIAEEVAEVAPDLAVRGPDGKIETVYYQDLPPMLLNEYQKQQHTIAAQQRVIEAQRDRLEALERRLSRLESKMGEER